MSRFCLGAGLVILSAAGFGFMPVFALYAYRSGINVSTLLFLRFTLAAIFFLAFLFGKERKITVSRIHLVSLMILGGVFYPLQATFYFSAVKYIPVSLTALLLYTYPVFVALISMVFEQERLTRQIAISLALSFSGLALVLGASFGALNFFGVFLALAAAIVYSCYIALGNRLVKKFPPLTVSALVSCFAALSLFAAGLLTGTLNFHFQPQAWLPVGGLILFSTVLSIFTFFRGLELIGSTRAAILSMFEPVVAVIFSALLFSERLTSPQILGGTVVLAGVALIISAGRQEEKTTGGTPD